MAKIKTPYETLRELELVRKKAQAAALCTDNSGEKAKPTRSDSWLPIFLWSTGAASIIFAIIGLAQGIALQKILWGAPLIGITFVLVIATMIFTSLLLLTLIFKRPIIGISVTAAIYILLMYI